MIHIISESSTYHAFLSRFRGLPQISYNVHCQRSSAEYIIADLSLTTPAVESTTYLKQAVVKTWQKLHQPDLFELHTLEIVVSN